MSNGWYQRFMEELDVYIARDPASRSRLEILLCYPGLHATLAYRLSRKLWKADFKLLARVLSQFARWMTGVEIHPGARIGRRLFIDHGMGIVIGETASIGDDVSMYHGVTLGGVSPTTDEKGSLRHPQVGDGVIIGSGAQILGPIEVGDYARIGSNAVVVNHVEPGATMVGIPARAIVPKDKRKAAEEDHVFEAYAVPHEKMDDPMEKLLEQVKRLSKRVHELEKNQEHIEETAENWESTEAGRKSG